MYKIMIVDDEENILKALKRILKSNKEWLIESYTHANLAIQHAMNEEFDLFIADYRMPEIDGVTFLTSVKNIQPSAM